MRKCDFKRLVVFLAGFLTLAGIFAQTKNKSDKTAQTKTTGNDFLDDIFGDADDAETSAEKSPTEINHSLNTDFLPQAAMAEPNYKVCAGDVYQLTFMMNGDVITYSITVDSSYKIRVANLGLINVAGKTYRELKSEVESIVLRNFPMGGPQFVLVRPSVFFVRVEGEVKKTSEVRASGLSRLSNVIDGLLTAYSSVRNITVTSADGKTSVYDLFLAQRFGDLENDPFLRPGDKITLGRIQRKVNIFGQVERPGEYELLEGENISRLIEYYGGGLTVFADLTRVEISRRLDENEKTGFAIYLSQEQVAADYALINYDRITIPSFYDLSPVVFIEGAIFITNEDDDTSIALESMNRVERRIQKGMTYSALVRQNSSLFGATSDLENSYIIRGEDYIPINLFDILYDDSKYDDIIAEPYDVLVIPFRQFFVTVSGAVNNPGRYPYIPNRKWDYYVGLAGGFVKSQNVRDAIEITDVDGKKVAKSQEIKPEMTITAKTNAVSFYINQYAPIVSSLLSIVSAMLSIFMFFSR